MAFFKFGLLEQASIIVEIKMARKITVAIVLAVIALARAQSVDPGLGINPKAQYVNSSSRNCLPLNPKLLQGSIAKFENVARITVANFSKGVQLRV